MAHKKIIVNQLSHNSKKDTYAVSEDEQCVVVLIATEATDYTAQVHLRGKNARADILGLVIGKGMETITIHTLQKHEVGETVSDLHIKSVLTDHAQFNYEGYIEIVKKAQKSNAYQRNDNLLLSDGAKAESKPALEILANDVRCTHGATIGKIDSEQLFYLQSRGLGQRAAEQLIISGFFQVLIDKIPDETVQTQILATIKEELYVT